MLSVLVFTREMQCFQLETFPGLRLAVGWRGFLHVWDVVARLTGEGGKLRLGPWETQIPPLVPSPCRPAAWGLGPPQPAAPPQGESLSVSLALFRSLSFCGRPLAPACLRLGRSCCLCRQQPLVFDRKEWGPRGAFSSCTTSTLRWLLAVGLRDSRSALGPSQSWQAGRESRRGEREC